MTLVTKNGTIIEKSKNVKQLPKQISSFSKYFSGFMLCAYLLNCFTPGGGMSMATKHMEMEAKVIFNLRLRLDRIKACHYLHTVDTYGRMRGDPFDCSTSDKSLGKLSEMHCYASDL